MSNQSLSILPNEVLEIIFGFVPKQALVKFKEIQENKRIQTILYKLLYSHITIWEFPLELHSNFIPSKSPHGNVTESSFEFLTSNDFIKTVKADPRIEPTRFLLAKFRTILTIHEQEPHLLKNTEIDICEARLNFKDYSTEELDIIFSYNINSFLNFTTSIDNVPYTRYLENVNIQCSQYSFESVANFTNITHLELINAIWPNQARLIPKSVTELTCNMYLEDDLQEVEPEFPGSLERLTLASYHGSSSYILHLEKLQKLKFLRLQIRSSNVILPKNITEFETKNMIDFEDLHNKCPKLRSLKLRTGLDIEENEGPRSISFPRHLRKLLLPYEMIYDSSNSPKPLDFPESLTDLTITVGQEERNKISFDTYNLNNLRFFGTQYSSYSVFITGQLPQNLHKLILSKVENIEDVLIGIQQLGALHELSIFNSTSMPTKFNAPSSLKILNMDSNAIEKISIIGRNIEVLNLEHNILSKLDNDTLSLPENLQRLNLRKNKIQQISSSFKWPKTLRQLDLSFNNLSAIENLPDWLEVLHGAGINKNSHFLKLTLPTNLRFLDLSRNNLHSKDLCKMSWEKYHTLQELNLAGNNLQNGLFFSQLPETLEYLNLDMNCFIEINESHLNQLQNLKEISICHNTTEFNFTLFRQKLKKRNIDVLF
ncbi:hypothetical protein G210_0031 [Candida maltosa Xu316]|uniref:Uncharacterized protein n=1 Tax=Candida maltosa (strain Xu316) TaxID=1245528 RepID=M3K3E9_CANMX|nr:hypothetical protein G210_0031 [Candida maltosa Xu316]